MRAAHALFMSLTVLILASAMPLAPANAFPSPFAKNAVPAADSGDTARSGRAGRTTRTTTGRHSVGPKPARWCGWWMRTQLGGGPEYNLARNWANRGRPLNGPRVGAVVVWSHHVGMITGRNEAGQWIVKSGNDGGRVRERPRNVSGAVFRKV
jgi:hypothetical protein